jgi:hypothetical protein
MRKFKSLLVFSLFTLFLHAQDAAVADSLKKKLTVVKVPAERFEILKSLSRIMMNVNPMSADSMGQEMIRIAEESRDRKLIFRSYLENGLRCSYFFTRKDYQQRAFDYLNKALNTAKENKLDDENGEALLSLSTLYLTIPETDKALQFAHEAFSIISLGKNDSLKCLSHISYGDVYLAKNEKIVALRHYLNALQLAEDIGNITLERKGYSSLSGFYASIDAYDKAIDYATQAYQKLDQINEKNVPYQRAIDLNGIGRLYAMKKNYDMAIYFYERSIRLADSLKFSTLKVPGYLGLLNLYLQMDQPERALHYLNSDQGTALKSYLNIFGYSKAIDQAYAVTYTGTGQYDSARKYFLSAAPFFEQMTATANRLGFYYQYAQYYRKTSQTDSAIALLLRANALGKDMGSLETVMDISKQLDTLYTESGEYKLAGTYLAMHYQYKDSLQKISKEKDVAQVEAADEQQRLEKAEKEEEDRVRRKNNIQYMAITLGIVALFVILVIFGMFKVSANTIRLIGFFAFLMFFEFIFLIFKKNIHSITEGEPWKDLAFMIGLAAFLVPLHHWLEEKVIHYLTSHNRLTAAGHHIRNKLFRRGKSQQD